MLGTMVRNTALELLIAAEVAQWLRISRSTTYGWAAAEKIPSVKLNGAVRFIRADIERWLNDSSNGFANSHPPTTRPIVPPKPTSVSRQTIQQAGARAIRCVTSMQSPKEDSIDVPQCPAVEGGQRKRKL
jgi:excisionase family DNA binding protein